MAITFINAGTPAANSVASTTLSVPYPSGPITANDVLVLVVCVSSTTLPTTPAGWTSHNSGTSGGSSPDFRMWSRYATGSESGSLSVTTPNQVSSGGMLLARGVDLTTRIDVAGTAFGSSTSTTAYNIPTVTTTVNGAMIIYCGTGNAASGSFTPPTVPASFTEDYDQATGLSSTMGHLIWSSSGATGTINLVRVGSTRGAAGIIVLRPQAPQLGDVAIAATSTITSTATVGAVGDVAIAATATIAASGTVGVIGDVAIAATDTITSAGTASGGAPTGDVAISETATVTSTGTVAAFGNVAISATDTVTSTATVGAVGNVSISETATVTATSTVATFGAVAIAATATITATGTVAVGPGSATIAETATVTATGAVGTASDSSIAAVATVVAAGSVGTVGDVAIVGTATVTTTGLFGATGDVAIEATAELLADGEVTVGLMGDVAIAAVATITASGAIHHIAPDDTLFCVEPEDRRWSVLSEERRLTVGPENRRYSVPSGG